MSCFYSLNCFNFAFMIKLITWTLCKLCTLAVSPAGRTDRQTHAWEDAEQLEAVRREHLPRSPQTSCSAHDANMERGVAPQHVLSQWYWAEKNPTGRGWRSRGVWSEANIQASGEFNLPAGWYEGKDSLNCRLNINTQTTQSHFAPPPQNMILING